MCRQWRFAPEMRNCAATAKKFAMVLHIHLMVSFVRGQERIEPTTMVPAKHCCRSAVKGTLLKELCSRDAHRRRTSLLVYTILYSGCSITLNIEFNLVAYIHAEFQLAYKVHHPMQCIWNVAINAYSGSKALLHMPQTKHE